MNSDNTVNNFTNDLKEKDNKKILISNDLISRTFSRDFIPVALATTFLAPLNRIKIVLQNMKLISINESDKIFKPTSLLQKIVKDQGLFSLWRGNLSNIYKQFTISFANILIYNRIQSHLKLNEDNNNSFLTRLFSVTLSSFITHIFYYPFELANTRICGDMTRYGHKRIYSSVTEVFSKVMEEEVLSRNNITSNLNLTRLYKGFSVSLASSIIYWTVTIGCYENLHKYFEYKKVNAGEEFEHYIFLRKMSIIFGATSLNLIFASFICYPLDTFKRHLQVTGSIGYKSDYTGRMIDNFNLFSREGFNGMYRGFGVNLLRILPFPFILYTIRADN